jgi:hypothetical protein
MRVMPDRQTLPRDEPRIERKRDGHRPAHGVAISAKTRLTVAADGVMAAPIFNPTLTIRESFFSPIPGAYLGLEKAKVVVLMISDSLVFPHVILHEFWRWDVMKLIGIGPQKPIAVAHLLTRHVKQVATQARLGKIDGFFPKRDHA